MNKKFIADGAREIFRRYNMTATRIMGEADTLAPDFQVGEDYLQRWWLAKIEDQHEFDRLGPLPPHTDPTYHYNLYLHRITGSDDDRAAHDHPWPSVSLIMRGQYLEHTPIGDFLRQPGDIVVRGAEDLHWLEKMDDSPVWSLFLTGRKVREWGFRCDDGRWIPWKEFVGYNPDDPDWWKKKGPGCGES